MAADSSAPEASPPFFADRLLLARHARGFTQKRTAEEVGVRQPLIAKWEKEDGPTPDAAQRARLGEALGVPSGFFSVAPPERRGLGASAFHRKLARAKASDLKRIHAACALAEERIDALLARRGAVPKLLPSIDPDNAAGDVNLIAGRVRTELGVLHHGPLPDLVELLERRGAFVVRGVVADAAVDALCRWRGERPTLFFVNADRPADRLRFSLAHELGHAVMHLGRDPDLDLAEVQANTFASAFLLPQRGVLPDLRPGLKLADFARLKRKWRVSIQALIRRAKDLHAIDERRYRSLMQDISRKGWRKNEPTKIADEHPAAVRSLLEERAADLGSVGGVADDLAMLEEDLRRWMGHEKAKVSGAPRLRLVC